MNNKLAYDSDFCTVKYMEKDSAVLLTWKKFARLDDYRRPTVFALNLLKEFPGSNFIVDARNGFEDDREDVKWGVEELLPNMAKTGCAFVAFIMQEADVLQEEMDLWTREFGKYFAVIKASSYQQAIDQMNRRILVTVNYTVLHGKRKEFLQRVKEQGIELASRQEPGNARYEYFLPVDSEDDLCLLEMWVSGQAQAAHAQTDHYQRLQVLKKEYVTAVKIEKYNIDTII